MSKINDGGPAFPSVLFKQEPTENWSSDGMTLRDWFAGQALGFGFDWTNVHETGGYAEAAQVAYEIADAMLRARSESGQ